MTKRLVDIDDDLLSVARTILETATMRDTVNAALKQNGIVRWRPNSGRLLEHQAQGDGGKGEHQGRHDRDAVQVLLNHGRACGLGTDTPTEHVGEATTLTAVEEDQEDDSQT